MERIKDGTYCRYTGTDTNLMGAVVRVVGYRGADSYTVQTENGRTLYLPDVALAPIPAARPACSATVPQDALGRKDDAGKPNPALLFEGCGAALAEVCKVLDGGSEKYAPNSWQQVPNGIERYKAAFYRHLQYMQVHGWDSVNTADFGLLHIDHAITDLLFIRSLMLKEAK